MAGHKLHFSIDLEPVVLEFMLSKQQSTMLTKKVLDDVTVLFLRNWKAIASTSLRSSRGQYLAGLKWISSGVLQNKLVLVGTLPNMIEQGASAFDMKDGFERSTKVKMSLKGNWYMHVPFRWAVPTSLGESSVFSGVLPKGIYDSIKKNVKPSYTGMDGKKSGGGGLKAINIPEEFKIQTKRTEITESKLSKAKASEYIHKTNNYEGITRAKQIYENATQSKYVSFRTVGKNSDANAFMHKGIKAYDFARRAIKMSDINRQVDNSIDEFLSAI